ncbi:MULTISPECIES: shufflon system plasmid conjugative transfer pilus tip adhesin PilV [Dickeya]|uniref:shufflon system plasmid conjugative transfer pilus tip adhesin PilV n=1 Tax=Dickeya TaxID=204037 RepID=UPI0003A51F04|nr:MULTISPECIES: shufflon system plasmid conjugative transfer pilus tip adhesin PilV [Dickeya]UGA50139.1 shufflon system plasmid conjugative transfer pilus tip adhesin PilV [Dickeya fangzhongdai]UWH06494.1 shufflon system plasmid conjugative transfer pilus tip adhesin PilV [Dickeya fangzhongdai]
MIRSKKGFSLLELILVLGVASAISFMKFQDLKHQQEDIQANAVGEQIKQVGNAVNGYINIRYDKLSTLTSVSTSTGTDPGPRTCSTADSTCTITYQTLINEGLLPSTFSGMNARRSGYNILLRRSGSSPNYVIDGLITTTTQWKEGDKIRYDLLGQAMQSAGVDSGVSKTASSVSGYSGQWTEQAASYKNITNEGLLAYRVGYNSAMYSVYLRRDGTLPMTGDLNMGGQDINNTVNITASGTTTSGILHSTGDTNVGANLNVSGNTQVNGTLNSNNTVSGATVTSRGETYTQNWFRTLGDTGWYSQKWGGGWYMSDSTWIRAYSNKNVYTGGQIRGGSVQADGRLTVGEFAQLNGVANAGAGCSPNGLVGRDGSGKILSCVNGVWTMPGGTSRNIGLYQCPYNICDNNSASTCSGQISTMNYCQCRQSGGPISCSYVGILVTN